MKKIILMTLVTLLLPAGAYAQQQSALRISGVMDAGIRIVAMWAATCRPWDRVRPSEAA